MTLKVKHVSIVQYQGEHGWQPRNYTGLCEKLLAKSQTVVRKIFSISLKFQRCFVKYAQSKRTLLQAGFFLVQYAHLWQQHLDNLVHLFSVGKLKVIYLENFSLFWGN